MHKTINFLLAGLLLLGLNVWADIDKTVLLTESKVFPKIILLDKELQAKIEKDSKTILIHIYYEKKYLKEAKLFA